MCELPLFEYAATVIGGCMVFTATIVMLYAIHKDYEAYRARK